VLVSDGFVLAKDAPHPQQTRELLRLMGAKSAQEAFNQRKGSICARLDCDRTEFSTYLNWSMDSFAQDAIVPTIIHGSAAPADFQQALNDALTTFVVERNVEQFAQALAQAARMSGFGK
jgi:glucose/mannose transport system substrate-binding protein